MIVARSKKEAKKTEAVKQYDLSHHLGGKPQEVIRLFEELREAIMSFSDEGSIQETINKQYLAYKTTRNFCEIVVQARGLKVYIDIDKGDGFEDPKTLAEDCSTKGHWATGNTRFFLSSEDETNYAVSLIKQAYNLTL